MSEPFILEQDKFSLAIKAFLAHAPGTIQTRCAEAGAAFEVAMIQALKAYGALNASPAAPADVPAAPVGWVLVPRERLQEIADTAEMFGPSTNVAMCEALAELAGAIRDLLAEEWASIVSQTAAPHPTTTQAPGLTSAAIDVLAERKRQVESEGWTAEHDDEHTGGEMAAAAACYATGRTYTRQEQVGVGMPRKLMKWVSLWPWDFEWWKPSGKRRNLVKAGALILAEIERLDRLTATPRLGADGEE